MEYEQDATWREGWWLGKRYKRGRSGRSCPSPTSSWRRAPPGWSSGTAPPEKRNIGLRLDLGQHLHGGDLKELLVLLLVHVEAGLHVLDQLHLVHLQGNVGLDEKSK